MKTNIFYNEDCIETVKKIDDNSISLIYVDPPFNKNRNFKSGDYTFKDKWDKDDITNNIKIDKIRKYLETIKDIGYSDIYNYLCYISERLVLFKDKIKDNGSLFYHCDYSVSHYIKIILDLLFDRNNFRNEIIWCYSNIGVSPKQNYPNKHDTIFFYSKNKDLCYYQQQEGIHHKSKKVTKLPDWWIDITSFNGYMKPANDKHYKYPTQKPLKLLERIVLTSTKENDVIFDPFCGSSPLSEVCIKNNRRYILSDINDISSILERRK